MSQPTKPIVPEVCDRLNCKVSSCYGWDWCRQARAEATEEEWDKLIKGLFESWDNPEEKKP